MTARLTLGNLIIDRGTYVVWIDGRPIDLTFIEFEILHTLARNQQRVTSRDVLARGAWGDSYRDHARNLTVHISRLRKKLRESRPYSIRTIPKRGYSLTNVGHHAPSPRNTPLTQPQCRDNAPVTSVSDDQLRTSDGPQSRTPG